MKKFLTRFFAYFLLIVLCLGLMVTFHYFVVGHQYTQNYQAALLDKTRRLKSIDEPKIILLGHSNLPFGMDSKLLEEEMGMPVVNMGLHGSLGNAFDENVCKFNVGEGDIVVIAHSTYEDTDAIDDPGLVWITIDNNLELLPVIRKKDIIPMLASYPNYFRTSLLLWATGTGNGDLGGCYSRNAFNEYGDVVVKPAEEQVDISLYFEETPVEVPRISKECVDRINELNEYCNERGATLVIAGYPIAYGKLADFDEQDFIDFQNELQSQVDCQVVSDFTDYFYPYDYFYNTILHLTDEATEIRTRQLASDLKKIK